MSRLYGPSTILAPAWTDVVGEMVRVSAEIGLLDNDRVKTMTSPVMIPSAMKVIACHGNGSDDHHVSFSGSDRRGDDVSDVFATR